MKRNRADHQQCKESVLEQITVLKAFLMHGENGISAWGVESDGTADFS